LRQKEAAIKTIAYHSACYFFMLASKEAAIKTIASVLLVTFLCLAPKEAAIKNNSLPFCLLLFYACAKRSGNQKQ
jgi:hypothetical protein